MKMKTHTLLVGDIANENDVFSALQSGKKTIDTRPFSPKYQRVRVGDVLKFVSISTKEKLEKKVAAIKTYESIEELFAKNDYKKIFPEAASKKQAEKCYEKFPGFAKKASAFGVVAFWLE